MKKTIIDLFEQSVDQFSDHVFLKEKIASQWIDTTYMQCRSMVYELAAGFVSIGVEPKDNMALLSEGRNMWIISELAMFYAGAANVPLSIKLEESNDLMFRLKHSDAKYIVVSGNQLGKIRNVIAQLPSVVKVIVLDPIDEWQDREVYVGDVIEQGKIYLQSNQNEFLKIGQVVQNDDLATITYTSGTTADPKGVCLSHRNYTANVEQSLSLMDIDSSWRTLVILPLDHCFAHVVGFYIFMSKGASVATVQTGKTPLETLKNIPLNIKEIKPHLILSVPALAKNFKKNIEAGIRGQSKPVRMLYKWGLSVAIQYNGDGENKGKGLRVVLKPLVKLFDRLIFSKIRENFGGELKFFIGGGALLDKDLQTFYYAIGVPMYQGYGLSEATPVISSNGPGRHKFGSSGPIVQPMDIRILDSEGRELPEGEKGEIVIRGENVMTGYWKNELSTQETIKDGWLFTGDLGAMKEGLLYVYGRFKSLLIGSDGEKYSPEGIEEAFVSTSKYIDQVMLHNNQNAYTVAVIVPNKEALKRSLAHHHLEWGTPAGQRKVVDYMIRDLNRFRPGGEYQGEFPERWLPAAFAIVPDAFTEQNQMLNSTMKMVRSKVEEYYAERIFRLYTIEGKDPYHNMGLFD